jgi:succinyl-diaminopimelate desuccinylase
MPDFESYLSANKNRFESDLFDWLKMASIGTDPAYDAEVHQAGNWLADQFRAIDLETEVIETCGHPIVYAQSPPVDGAPTILIYGHYDVQPPDPLDLWETPPFEPTVRDGNVYARGATDDKGQMITHLFSAEAWMKTVGSFPVQLKFLIEGEEESGSSGLNELLAGKYDAKLGMPIKEKLDADIAVISDTAQYGPGKPAVTYGLRGIYYFELRVTGPNRDLHSGSFGGTITNPANALTNLLSKLINEKGQIQIPGFYDGIVPMSQQERDQFADLGFDDTAYGNEIGVDKLVGEEGFSTLERRWARPTFDINGLWSGYQGDGAKTVLPSVAGAKFSFRLVPGQDLNVIKAGLESFLSENCPPGIKYELIDMHGAPGCVVPLDSPFMKAAFSAIETGFGAKPVFIRSGGSIPVVNSFAEMLGMNTLLLGWGQMDDNLHSPNEKFSLDDFHKGIKSSCALWEELGKISV